MANYDPFKCKRCNSVNVSAYQIIQTQKKLIVWYRCIICGKRQRSVLDVSEKNYLMDILSVIFFKCYRCGSPITILELLERGKTLVMLYQCTRKRKGGKKVISNQLYHDLRITYLNNNSKIERIRKTTSRLSELNEILCPKCKKLIEINSNFCMYCGANIRELKDTSVICPKCGIPPRHKEDKFCRQCGALLPGAGDKESEDLFEGYIECYNCGAMVPKKEFCIICRVQLRCTCGAYYTRGLKRCESCNREIEKNFGNEEVKCPKCGEPIKLFYDFCTKCGELLYDDDSGENGFDIINKKGVLDKK
ncbi:MAG: double zinc ribbon domain-containing protein [Candidatus Helarchaeota archaeon]